MSRQDAPHPLPPCSGVVEGAIDLLTKQGWSRTLTNAGDGDGPLDVTLALSKAAALKHEGFREWDDAVHAAYGAVMAEVRSRGYGLTYLSDWNGDVDRTWGEVLDVLQAAAERLQVAA